MYTKTTKIVTGIAVVLLFATACAGPTGSSVTTNPGAAGPSGASGQAGSQTVSANWTLYPDAQTSLFPADPFVDQETGAIVQVISLAATDTILPLDTWPIENIDAGPFGPDPIFDGQYQVFAAKVKVQAPGDRGVADPFGTGISPLRAGLYFFTDAGLPKFDRGNIYSAAERGCVLASDAAGSLPGGWYANTAQLNPGEVREGWMLCVGPRVPVNRLLLVWYDRSARQSVGTVPNYSLPVVWVTRYRMDMNQPFTVEYATVDNAPARSPLNFAVSRVQPVNPGDPRLMNASADQTIVEYFYAITGASSETAMRLLNGEEAYAQGVSAGSTVPVAAQHSTYGLDVFEQSYFAQFAGVMQATRFVIKVNDPTVAGGYYELVWEFAAAQNEADTFACPYSRCVTGRELKNLYGVFSTLNDDQNYPLLCPGETYNGLTYEPLWVPDRFYGQMGHPYDNATIWTNDMKQTGVVKARYDKVWLGATLYSTEYHSSTAEMNAGVEFRDSLLIVGSASSPAQNYLYLTFDIDGMDLGQAILGFNSEYFGRLSCSN